MNNKEKLFLVKLARGAANTPEQMQSYQRLNPSTPPAPGSRSYRELPKAERQSILSARDKQQARGLAKGNVATPTTKGGLNNIPPRPAAHPLSKGVMDNYLEEDMDNTIGRMGQQLRILPYLKEGFPYLP